MAQNDEVNKPIRRGPRCGCSAEDLAHAAKALDFRTLAAHGGHEHAEVEYDKAREEEKSEAEVERFRFGGTVIVENGVHEERLDGDGQECPERGDDDLEGVAGWKVTGVGLSLSLSRARAYIPAARPAPYSWLRAYPLAWSHLVHGCQEVRFR